MKWIFEGRVYSSLEELNNKTMSEGNKPEPVFNKNELDGYAKVMALDFARYLDAEGVNFERWGFDPNMYDEYLKNFNKVDVGEGAESESEL